MDIKVVKFGGTSMADAESIKKVCNIIKSDKERRFVVVSAPGKISGDDIKVTDLLYSCAHELQISGDISEYFEKIKLRFKKIVSDLKMNFDIDSVLNEVEKGIYLNRTMEYAASRGEYLSARILSEYLGYNFIDAKDIVFFNEKGQLDEEKTNAKTAAVLCNLDNAVVPGFYGADITGTVKTFSRGGSDVTGAIIAKAVNASVYENWTDVNGFMCTDPRIVKNPKRIEKLSYKELRELSYMGANVLHPESIFPLKSAGIPINIRNTFEPENSGTMILPEISEKDNGSLITGIAGKKNFALISIEKSMMNSELGFARKVLTILEEYEISFEHMPSGIDTLCVIVAESELIGKSDAVIQKITHTVNPDHIELTNGIALIATVGHGMAYKPGTAAKLFKALSDADINVKMIDQGSSELNIIVAVADADYEKAIEAIYNQFFIKK